MRGEGRLARVRVEMVRQAVVNTLLLAMLQGCPGRRRLVAGRHAAAAGMLCRGHVAGM